MWRCSFIATHRSDSSNPHSYVVKLYRDSVQLYRDSVYRCTNYSTGYIIFNYSVYTYPYGSMYVHTCTWMLYIGPGPLMPPQDLAVI